MANQDWSNLGDEIKNLVQSAVESQNFKQLNETLGKTINEAMENVNVGLNKAGDKLNQATKDYEHKYKKTKTQNPWRVRSFADKPEVSQPHQIRLYRSTTGMTGLGSALAVTGYLLAGGMGIATLIIFLVGIVGGFVFGQAVAVGVLAPLILGSGIMAAAGSRILKRVKRFKSYVRELGSREYCSIKELARAIGKTEGFVRKDLRDMLERGMFVQGHMDKQQSCLMVTDEIFQQYHNAQMQLDMQQQPQESIAAKQQEELTDGLSEEVRKIIEEGRNYIQEIRKSNDAIEGEEISLKISRMELIIEKILIRVEKQPELVADMHKFMSYYLPTTVKLLNAYEELDAQEVQGPNIVTSKKEIEETLDTVNHAFENLLDSFFQNRAWDISSDISVLQTMLAQEGLTNSDFSATENRD